MHSAKEKVSNMESVTKEKVKMCAAKGEENAEMTTAMTSEERAIAHERRKAKEAQAKMELHEEKALHAGEKLDSKLTHHHHTVNPQHSHGTTTAGMGTTPVMGAPAAPSKCPLGGGYPPGVHSHVL
ncbi:unnamed protein product [Rhodiola kirilowii]